MKPIRSVCLWVCLCVVVDARAGGLEEYPDVAPTPPLALADLAGKLQSLGDYRGQVVLVNFWASWCAPCLVEMPSMQRLKEKFAGKPFQILAVNVRESAGTIWKFHKLIQVDFPLLLDRDGQASEDWQVVVYPSTYLVDTRGRIRYQSTGMRKWDDPEIVMTIEGMLRAPERGTETVFHDTH
jgi:thiol-disulfide isomerase/thioredoxin